MNAFIGLGANLPSAFGSPEDTVRAAVAAVAAELGPVAARSRLWRSAPVPLSDQPWYVNAVAQVSTSLPPSAVLAVLKALEAAFGRAPGAERNAARVLDLDLLDYGGQVLEGCALTLPHPRMGARAFVLYPLREVAPGWAHPVSGISVRALIDALPGGQEIEAIDAPA